MSVSKLAFNAIRRLSSSVNPNEIAKFSSHSSQWWQPKGEFYFLHKMNPTRLSFIRKLANQHTPSTDPKWPLQNKRILDIGCGGGLLSESLARMGSHVLGVDASEANIHIAQHHAKHQKFNFGSLSYQCNSAEDLQAKGLKFDIICALELLEHVDQPHLLLQVLLKMLEPNGLLFVSTINRTSLSNFLSITLAEHVFQWISKGTHEYRKYITPQELRDYTLNQAKMLELQGFYLNPISLDWSLCTLPDPFLVNYIACLQLHAAPPEPHSFTGTASILPPDLPSIK